MKLALAAFPEWLIKALIILKQLFRLNKTDNWVFYFKRPIAVTDSSLNIRPQAALIIFHQDHSLLSGEYKQTMKINSLAKTVKNLPVILSLTSIWRSKKKIEVL